MPLKPEFTHRAIQQALPGCRIVSIEPLTEGRRHCNQKVTLDAAPGCVVLRVYQHEPTLCQKELDLMRLVWGAVPVPETIHAEPCADPPFTVSLFIPGLTFRELRRTRDREAIAQASASAGETLAAIGRFRFDRGGWIEPGPVVTWPLMEGSDPIPRFIDKCLADPCFEARVASELRDRVHKLTWSQAEQLRSLPDNTSLVHGDFDKRNVLVHLREGRWRVAAILDWEFAVSGSPLGDLANFLRYEPFHKPLAEPFFSEAFQRSGGCLPPGWTSLIRLVDLTALCPALADQNTPPDICSEIAGLVDQTVTQFAQSGPPPTYN